MLNKHERKINTVTIHKCMTSENKRRRNNRNVQFKNNKKIKTRACHRAYGKGKLNTNQSSQNQKIMDQGAEN